MLLNIDKLSVVFHDRGAAFEAVDEVSLQVDKGEMTAQKAYEAAVASHASMIDPQIFSAIIFALIGFSLVTGIEIAGKMMKK